MEFFDVFDSLAQLLVESQVLVVFVLAPLVFGFADAYFIRFEELAVLWLPFMNVNLFLFIIRDAQCLVQRRRLPQRVLILLSVMRD